MFIAQQGEKSGENLICRSAVVCLLSIHYKARCYEALSWQSSKARKKACKAFTKPLSREICERFILSWDFSSRAAWKWAQKVGGIFVI